jgi:hypothetical protein
MTAGQKSAIVHRLITGPVSADLSFVEQFGATLGPENIKQTIKRSNSA